ncbi:MAG: YciK family oxidoreductase [Gammaproteobacteria bacterium]|nr:YciK family oxidoreductase [Gammaproteobacteria bacterium]NNF61922.1 YciK family oxidoreductase [Gammaproteobacteria bacterium]NNM19774.1 YciK family oxidoreductase [Gammaproteobacteria bacterium]
MIETIDYSPAPQLMHDRTVLITGAGDGIGRAVSLALAHQGATVVLLGRTGDKLAKVSDEIVSSGAPQPAILEADLEKLTWDEYLALAEALKNEFGRLDGLLHNASILGDRAPIEHYDPMTWHRVMHVNVGAAFLLTRATLDLLKQSPDPAILFTSSGVGRSGRAFWGAYAVSKFATEGFMQVLADEMTGMRINCINPGPTRTSMRAAAFPGEDPKNPAEPETLVNAYLYLLGPDSAGISGRSFDAQGAGAAKPQQR